jgi:hypothetical protein
MIITKQGYNLKLGTDFAEAFTGTKRSHGAIEIDNKLRYTWESTQDIATSEHALRLSVKREGRKLTCFESQAI